MPTAACACRPVSSSTHGQGYRAASCGCRHRPHQCLRARSLQRCCSCVSRSAASALEWQAGACAKCNSACGKLSWRAILPSCLLPCSRSALKSAHCCQRIPAAALAVYNLCQPALMQVPEDPWELQPTSFKLAAVLDHLRGRHHHCIFCGAQVCTVHFPLLHESSSSGCSRASLCTT